MALQELAAATKAAKEGGSGREHVEALEAAQVGDISRLGDSWR